MSTSSSDEIAPEDIHVLLEHFVKTTHKVKDGDMKGEFIMERCLVLFAKDYRYAVIKNFNGELCGHYPSKIVLLEYQLSEEERSSTKRYEEVQSMYDVPKLRDLVKQARYARCRSRFAVPVILYEGRHVCRSATLASGAEMYGRSGLDFLFSGADGVQEFPEETEDSGRNSGTEMFDRVRGQDKRLLKNLSVKYICDLMVEKKKVKFGMNVTSSEKVDKENRYAEFCILAMPYPGCEFFKEWKDNSYLGETMTFDWNQGYCDSILDIPSDPLLTQLGLDWRKYRNWDLIQLTQNYIKLLLHILKEGDNGVLIHCISGWDRTPMFISLLRLSLWADGVAHASLTPSEILYLTLAYDWYLFGHNLPDRVNKGEEILFFCFNFLTHITSDEFSVHTKRETNSVKRNDSECNMDGVLLENSTSSIVKTEADHRRFSIRGSNTSISSLGSGSLDGCPVFFNNTSDEDSHLSNGWQVVSSCGSLRGLVSSHDSPHSAASSNSSGRLSSCQEATEVPETTRLKKLDAVRRIFHNAYTNKIASKCKEGGAIANLMNQFAEKVGIRGRTTQV